MPARMGLDLADRRVAAVLRLVAPHQRAADRPVDTRKLRSGSDTGTNGREQAAARSTDAAGRDRLQSVLSRLFQIPEFPCRRAERRIRHQFRFDPGHSPAGHFIHHLSKNRVPGGRAGWPGKPILVSGLRSVRPVLPATHRRPDRALPGDDAAVPSHLLPFRRGECRDRRDSVLPWAGQEAVAGRSAEPLDRAALWPGRRRRSPIDNRSLDRSTGLHVADLFRLFGLHRHGAGTCPVLRDQTAGQLQLAAEGPQHHRVLAALACQPDPVPDSLHLQSHDAHASLGGGWLGAKPFSAAATRRSPLFSASWRCRPF